VDGGDDGVWEAALSDGAPEEKSADEFVVLAVRTNPEPMNTAWNWQTERAVVQADSDTVKSAVAYSLELKRRMPRVSLELSVAAVSKCLDVSRQRVQALPEAL
jgi:hypothetical protein